METTLSLKLFRPHAAPALELCSHFEATLDASPNKVRGASFHLVIAQLMEAVASGSEITPAMAGPFRDQCDWALQIQAELVPKIWGIEEEVILYDSDHEFITSGTLDLWGRSKEGRLEIIDWKTGQERAYGAQLAVYGVAMMDQTGDTQIGLHTAFVDQERVFSLTCTLDELRTRVDSLIEAVLDPASPYSINAYCGYCNLRDTCPAWAAERKLVANFFDKNLTLAQRFSALKNDSAKLAAFLVAFRRVKNMVEKVERLDSVALEMIQGGKRLPGLTKISRKGDESINAGSLKTLIYQLDASALDKLLKVDLKVARELWAIYSAGQIPFPKTTVGEPSQYIALSRNGK